ncbi:MAG: hypothetical protein A6D91_08675 [Bacillaceae bacterium G1]|nr:MAG: hypothetical protein A6D91_08675 [Bacillaceae bacterium G1]
MDEGPDEAKTGAGGEQGAGHACVEEQADGENDSPNDGAPLSRSVTGWGVCCVVLVMGHLRTLLAKNTNIITQVCPIWRAWMRPICLEDRPPDTIKKVGDCGRKGVKG